MPQLCKPQGQSTDYLDNIFSANRYDPQAIYAELRAGEYENALANARRGDVRAENNFAAGITTNFLIMGAITQLGPKCCALKAFSRSTDVDPYKPLATGVQKFNTTAQAGNDVMTNATDFTGQSNDGGVAGDSTLTGIDIAVNQYTQPLHLTSQQLNSGIRMADLIEAKLGSFLSKIVQVVTAPITVANFSNFAPLVIPAVAFGFSDLANLQGELQKSRVKNVILSGPYIARISNTPGFFQKTGTLGGLEGAWSGFGWDLVGLNTEWQAADPNVQGFACNPQAIGVIVGLPEAPVDGNNVIQTGTAILPGINAAVQVNLWMDANARTMRATYDVMLGANLVDSTAGILIKSQ